MSARNFIAEYQDDQKREIAKKSILHQDGNTSSWVSPTGTRITSPSTIAFENSFNDEMSVAQKAVEQEKENKEQHQKAKEEPFKEHFYESPVTEHINDRATAKNMGVNFEVPEKELQREMSASPSSWFKAGIAAAQENPKTSISISIVVVVILIMLIVFTSVAANSGHNEPERKFPRLVLFFVDGVSVEEFYQAAAMRRIPSMDFFASQSVNCRPNLENLESLNNPYGGCTVPNSNSRAGNMFSLLTGQHARKSPSSSGSTTTTNQNSEFSLSDIAGKNFSTFLRSATKSGLQTAILGNTPLLTVEQQQQGNSAAADTNNKLCGILDMECELVAERKRRETAGDDSSITIPPCKIPSTSSRPPSSMITTSSSCNSMIQGLIAKTDTPESIWSRIQYSLEAQDTDLLLVQIPKETMEYWESLHVPSSFSSSSSSSSSNTNNNNKKNEIIAEFANDAALYSVDGIFSNMLREVTLRSIEHGEQWLTFLFVADSTRESEVLVASNIVAIGERKDDDVASGALDSRRLYSSIEDWITKKAESESQRAPGE